VFNRSIAYRDRKLSVSFVRFRAPLQQLLCKSLAVNEMAVFGFEMVRQTLAC
jgi:hypothetical protein